MICYLFQNQAQLLSVCMELAEPRPFQEAWNHPDPEQCMKWKEAIRKEFDKIPKGWCCIKCKWVFKIKRNGIIHACLVAFGYSKIPGVNFSENYSPVINDVTFRICVWPQSKDCGYGDCFSFFFMVILKKKYSWSVHQE